MRSPGPMVLSGFGTKYLCSKIHTAISKNNSGDIFFCLTAKKAYVQSLAEIMLAEIMLYGSY